MFLDHPKMSASTVNMEMFMDQPKLTSAATVNRELLRKSKLLLSPLKMAAEMALGKSVCWESLQSLPNVRRETIEYGLKFVRLLLKHPEIKIKNEKGWSLSDQAR